MPGPNAKRYEKEREKYSKLVIKLLKESGADLDLKDESFIKDIKKCLSFKQMQYKIYEIFNYAEMKKTAAAYSESGKVDKTIILRALLLPLFNETTENLGEGEITLILYLSSKLPSYTEQLSKIKEGTKDGEYKIEDFNYALNGLIMKGIVTHFDEFYSLVGFKKIGRK